MGSYVPNSPAVRQEMLAAMGASSIRDLYANVPEEMFVRELDLPAGAPGGENSGQLRFLHPRPLHRPGQGLLRKLHRDRKGSLAYLLTLGREGVPEASENAVLNANYMMWRLAKTYDMAYNGWCMHEFVMTLEKLHKDTGVSAMDIAKDLLDHGIHPPTMYSPLIVHEALMVEPTETESKETMDEACAVFEQLYQGALRDPQSLHEAPRRTPVRRLDEVSAARNPVLRYEFPAGDGEPANP